MSFPDIITRLQQRIEQVRATVPTFEWAEVATVAPPTVLLDSDATATPRPIADVQVAGLTIGDRVEVRAIGSRRDIVGVAGGVGSVDPDPDTVVQRTSDGRAKAADGVAADDVVTKGLSDAAHTGTWQAIWMAARTTTLSVPNTSDVLVTWPAAYYDPLSLVVNSSAYIEVPTTGYYRLVFHMSWQNDAGGDYRIAYYQENRATNNDWGLTMTPDSITMRGQLVVGAVYLTAGDEISITVRQNSGSTLSMGVSGQARMILERMTI